MKMRKSLFGSAALISCVLWCASSGFATPRGFAAPRAGSPSSGATITFRKVFKSSYPEFVEIKVSDAGAGTCDIRQLDEDPNPRPLDVGAPL
ncbi:MAG TPA: hypothetical protein VJW93_02660, partial [Candidatus Acidoferrales bacterium]|nr:hypothetical protein [Candidatus Acidoferrales bacterium]